MDIKKITPIVQPELFGGYCVFFPLTGAKIFYTEEAEARGAIDTFLGTHFLDTIRQVNTLMQKWALTPALHLWAETYNAQYAQVTASNSLFGQVTEDNPLFILTTEAIWQVERLKYIRGSAELKRWQDVKKSLQEWYSHLCPVLGRAA